MTILCAEPQPLESDCGLIEMMLFESGRPVIVVPARTAMFSTRHIVVAWDGSAPAARAAHEALPFLRAADTVEVVAVVGDHEIANSVAAAEIAPHLARHGVNVIAIDLPHRGDISDSLRQHIRGSSAEMLVMGGYGHSRIRGWIFGGVTQSFRKQSPVPLFIAH